MVTSTSDFLHLVPSKVAASAHPDSTFIIAVNFSSASETKRFPSSRCASAIQIVRPLESIAEIESQLQRALLRLSAMISQYLTLGGILSFCSLPGNAAAKCADDSSAIVGSDQRCPQSRSRRRSYG